MATPSRVASQPLVPVVCLAVKSAGPDGGAGKQPRLGNGGRQERQNDDDDDGDDGYLQFWPLLKNGPSASSIDAPSPFALFPGTNGFRPMGKTGTQQNGRPPYLVGYPPLRFCPQPSQATRSVMSMVSPTALPKDDGRFGFKRETLETRLDAETLRFIGGAPNAIFAVQEPRTVRKESGVKTLPWHSYSQQRLAT